MRKVTLYRPIEPVVNKLKQRAKGKLETGLTGAIAQFSARAIPLNRAESFLPHTFLTGASRLLLNKFETHISTWHKPA